jgi:hypothetical protein
MGWRRPKKKKEIKNEEVPKPKEVKETIQDETELRVVTQQQWLHFRLNQIEERIIALAERIEELAKEE